MLQWKLEIKVSCFATHPMKSPVSRAQTRDETRRVPEATWSTMFCWSLATLLFLYYLWAPFEGDVERPESKHRDGHKQLQKTLSFAVLHRIARFWLWFVKGGDWTRGKKKKAAHDVSQEKNELQTIKNHYRFRFEKNEARKERAKK